MLCGEEEPPRAAQFFLGPSARTWPGRGGKSRWCRRGWTAVGQPHVGQTTGTPPVETTITGATAAGGPHCARPAPIRTARVHQQCLFQHWPAHTGTDTTDTDNTTTATTTTTSTTTTSTTTTSTTTTEGWRRCRRYSSATPAFGQGRNGWIFQ